MQKSDHQKSTVEKLIKIDDISWAFGPKLNLYRVSFGTGNCTAVHIVASNYVPRHLSFISGNFAL